MNSDFNISEYMSNGIENVVNGVLKASFKNPKETTFVVKYALSNNEAKKRHIITTSMRTLCNR